MTTTKALNIPMLKDACKQSPKITAIFEHYLNRERGRQTSTIPRLRRVMKEEANIDLSKEEAIEIFRIWQKAEAGRYVSGRNDQDNRFLWEYSIPHVAEAVLEKKSAATLRAEEIAKSKGEKVEPDSSVKAAPKGRVKLPKPMPAPVPAKAPLKPNLKVATDSSAQPVIRFPGFELILPPHMTDKENKELLTFINNLRASVSQ
jgi:hypothetical protein